MTVTKPTKQRLASLDALRGMDMFWILGGQAIFAALFILTGWTGWQAFTAQTVHSVWHGFTFYDLIFPLFIFLSGVAMGLSPKRIDHLGWQERQVYYRKALKRLMLLCGLGILYNHGWGTGMPMAVDDIRYASVLSRIAIAWFCCAMLVWHTCLRSQAMTAIGLLLGYWILLCFVPVPGGVAGDLSAAGSWNAWFDKHFLPGMSYQNRVVDPEGILSNIPAIINAIAGVFAGRLIAQATKVGEWKTAGLLFILGVISLSLGWLWDLQFPVNKELWTSSFVLVTIGWSAILLAVFYALVDILPGQRLAYPFVIIGANSIIIYLASSLVDWDYISQSVFGGLIRAVSEPWQPLLGVITLLTVQMLVLHWMYRRKIFVSV
ncbi:transmembrane glucosamine N-acetyltransferase NagX [Pseudoalteromonas mariniglutinosa]|uniref:transmembrane glucosamine N-acetyltransferase NagX n=1 Tax=Pseudoalteromonas mariniglutinosa TaxID=206042 RepID=UPI00384DBBCE